MSTTVLYVSMRNEYRDLMSLDDLRDVMRPVRGISLSKLESADMVIAFVDNVAVGAWRLLGAYASRASADEGNSISLSLGSALSIPPGASVIPPTRHGIALMDIDIT